MLRKWLAENKWLLFFETLLVVVVLVSHVYVATTPPNSLMNWFNSDDAFFYFRVAQHIVAGDGITFDGIHATNGFHPLWLAVCVPVFAIAGTNQILALRIIVGVLALLNATTGVLLFQILRKLGSTMMAGIIALIWVCYPPVHVITTTRGLESGISACFLVLLLLLSSRWRMTEGSPKSLWKLFWVGVVAGLALLSRLDNVFTVGFIGLWLVLESFPFPRLLLLDITMVWGSILGSALLRLGAGTNFYPFLGWIFAMLSIAIVTKPLIFALFGLYRPLREYNNVGLILRIIAAALTASLVLSGFMLGLHAVGVFHWSSRSMLFLDFGLTSLFLAAARFLFRRFSEVDETSDILNRMGAWVKVQWKSVLQRGLAYFIPVGGMLSAFMAWSYIRFGTLSPISGQIKHWWATMSNTVYGHPVDGLALLGFSSSGNYGPWSIIFGRLSYLTNILSGWFGSQGEQPDYALSFTIILIVIILIASLIWWRWNVARNIIVKSGMLPLLAGCLIQIGYYLGTGYPNTRSWYWVGELLVVALLSAALVEVLYQGVRRWKLIRIISQAALAYAVVLILFSYGNYIQYIAPAEVAPEHANDYLGDVNGLLQYTEPGSLIGMPGGGMISYFLEDRTVVNLDGLMNDMVWFRAMQNGTATEILDNLGLDYVFGNEYMVTSSDPYVDILANRLVKIGFIRGPEDFTLFQYVPPE